MRRPVFLTPLISQWVSLRTVNCPFEKAVRLLRMSAQARFSAVSPEAKMVLFSLGMGEGLGARASWPGLLACE